MGGYREDIICARCGHAVLLDEIVRVFLKHKDTEQLQQQLEPLIAKAKQAGFGEDEVSHD
jgi:hypothetical protein